ncbi:hypothetical protein D3C80_1731520 [compost metagenome]
MINPAEVKVDLNWFTMASKGSSQKAPVPSKSLMLIPLPIAMAMNMRAIPIKNNVILISICLINIYTIIKIARMAAPYIIISIIGFSS